ncbi:ROK family protein [Pseudothermotoga sp.]|nr:ROK family protein [Pseudothermotoga sp.]MDW8140409.1 ROK family protein [Pseudothermotoga sp.]
MIIALDIGGTAIKGGLVSKEGFLKNKFVLTNYSTPMMAIFELIEEFLSIETRIEAIAVATAGRVNIETGVVLYASPNIPNWTGTPIAKNLSERYKLPCFVLNDAQAAAFGEAKVRNIESLVMLTIGTGLGGGIVLNGKLIHGYNHEAGEIGHTILKPRGKLCNCGKRGCAERYISMQVLHRYCRIENREELIKKFQKKEAAVIEGLERMCEDLAVLIDKVFLMIDPQVVVIGGGFSELGPVVLEVLRKKIEPHSTKSLYKPSQIELSLLKNDAGIIGAALYAEENLLRC